MSSYQLTTGPMGLERNKVSVRTETHGNSVAVDFCELIVDAFTRTGYSDVNAAAILDMKKGAFSKALRDVNGKYPDQNPLMKKLGQIPAEVLREFFALGSARVGLSTGIDHAKVQASVEFAEAAMRLLKVSER